MSRKISDFFQKKPIIFESNEKKQKIENQSSLIKEDLSIKLELAEDVLTSKGIPVKIPESNEDLRHDKLIKNIKTEEEKELLVILPHQKIENLKTQIKIEENKPKTDNFQCHICSKVFKTATTLEIHKSIHNKKFQCKFCDKNFSEIYILRKHIENYHENPRSFKCDTCGKGFNIKVNLKIHQQIHNPNRPKPFKCNQCDFVTHGNSNLQRHLNSHKKIIKKCEKCGKILHKNRIHDCSLNCKFCGQKFSRRGIIVNHIKRFHAKETGNKFFECDICGLRVSNKKFLQNHMEAKHADGKRQTFVCDLDGKFFETKALIYQHMKVHLPTVKCDFCDMKLKLICKRSHIINCHSSSIKKQFKCQICSKTVSSKAILYKHLKDHNKNQKCKFCEKLFGDKSKLKVHVRNFHENPKSFSCNNCDKKFSCLGNLKVHQKIHDPNRTWKFNCTQCDYKSDAGNAFRDHLNFHEKINARIAAIKNPQKCLQCPSVFKNKDGLQSHMITVHPKVLVECDVCGNKMKTKRILLNHLKVVHKFGIGEKRLRQMKRLQGNFFSKN